MRDDRARLLDILEAIDSIEKYSIRGYESVSRDELIQVWIVHHLQIIGEAVARLSRELKEQYDHVPWKDVIGMRNILVHHYFSIDFQEVGTRL